MKSPHGDNKHLYAQFVKVFASYKKPSWFEQTIICTSCDSILTKLQFLMSH